MAKIIGDLKKILDDEKYVINSLSKTLDDNYYIFYKPFLNGEIPDIVLLKKNAGIYIINISRINPDNIKKIDKLKDIIFLENGNEVKMPTKKILEQKYNLYGYHMETLNRAKNKSYGALGLVSTSIVFVKSINSKIKKYFQDNKYLKNFAIDTINELVNDIKNKLEKINYYFTDEIFTESYEKLSGIIKKSDYFNNITLSKKQQQLVISKSGKYKIKGFAGSGKTMVLINRVINHINRVKANGITRPKVLILTFNITLRNYILGNIQKLSNYQPDMFIQINHYHKFVADMCNLYNIPYEITNDDNENTIIDFNIDDKKKYDGIFIDEIQDYCLKWQNILLKNFLKKNGEYVVFGDEKQNIYERKLEQDSTARTNIRGRWNILEESHRACGRIVDVAINFQKTFLEKKYILDNFAALQCDLFALEQVVKYIPVMSENIIDLSNEVKLALSNPIINAKKSIILGTYIKTLRELEYNLRDDNLEHILTFETVEEYDDAVKNANMYADRLGQLEQEEVDKKLKLNLYEIRKCKKYNFPAKEGLKFSTIHSFKGWQEDTVILIINNDDQNNNDELIYTALTRCRKNLIIIDYSVRKKYENFFEECIYGDTYESN